MTSKVLVKLPMVPFPQEKKPPGDIVTLSDRTDGSNQARQQTINIDRAAQLEQNMKFLQEQHQATLIALHQEVETLRQRNRDLQFQLVFSKGATSIPSSPSSPEDNGNGFVKPKGSPGCVNVTPLQIELLEKELQDTKASLQETKTHNQYLSEIIEQQKKRLDSAMEQKNKCITTDIGVQAECRLDSEQADLAARLEDAETVMKWLRRQNFDQRREIALLKAASGNNGGGTSRDSRARDTNSSHYSHGSSAAGMQEQTSHKFPPLQSQSYRHRRLTSYDQNSEYHRNGRSRYDKQETHAEADNTVLPQLQNGSAKQETVIYEPPFYRSRGYHNYYREGSNRKYRGQMSQRERRESEQRYNRRELKDRSLKDRQKEAKEFVDPAGTLKDDHATRKQ